MNRFALAVVLGFGVWLTAGSAGSAEEPKGASPAAAAVQKGAALSREVIEREKAIQTWRDTLNGSKWNVEITVSSRSPVAVVEPDVLTFDRRTMNSETLAKAGYPPASYSLYPPTESSVEWEAMHSHTDKGVEETSIWRGQFNGKTVQGTLSRSRKKGDKETTDTLSFKGQLVESAPAAEPVPAAAAPTQGGAPVAPAEAQAPGAP